MQIKAINTLKLHCTKLQRWNVFFSFLLAPEFQDLFQECIITSGAKIWTVNNPNYNGSKLCSMNCYNVVSFTFSRASGHPPWTIFPKGHSCCTSPREELPPPENFPHTNPPEICYPPDIPWHCPCKTLQWLFPCTFPPTKKLIPAPENFPEQTQTFYICIHRIFPHRTFRPISPIKKLTLGHSRRTFSGANT